MNNHTLRQTLRKKRKSLNVKQRQYMAFLASLQLPKLLPYLPKHAKIGLYLDDFGELPTAPIIKFCQKNGLIPYLPITHQNKPLIFAPIFYELSKTPLKKHKLGMKEPFLKKPLNTNQLDCIICPLVAVNKMGLRLGMGGGFYDRTFAHFRGLKIGWCYHFQVMDNLIANDWDVGVDIIITNKSFIRC